MSGLPALTHCVPGGWALPRDGLWEAAMSEALIFQYLKKKASVVVGTGAGGSGEMSAVCCTSF